MNWQDRRPIGSLYISQVFTQNPTATKAQLQTLLLQTANTSVQICKDMNAQGVILWDMAGDDVNLTSQKYVGDPRIQHPVFAPIADQFFKIFDQAGLKHGYCVRGGAIVKNAYTGQLDRLRTETWEWDIYGKIYVGHHRWGSKLFYVDSNINEEGLPMRPPYDVPGNFTDSMIIMEHIGARPGGDWSASDYLGSFAGLCDGDLGPLPAGPIFVEFNMTGYTDARHQEFVDFVKAGNILMFRSWWGDPLNAICKQIYHDAGIAGF